MRLLPDSVPYRLLMPLLQTRGRPGYAPRGGENAVNWLESTTAPALAKLNESELLN